MSYNPLLQGFGSTKKEDEKKKWPGPQPQQGAALNPLLEGFLPEPRLPRIPLAEVHRHIAEQQPAPIPGPDPIPGPAFQPPMQPPEMPFMPGFIPGQEGAPVPGAGAPPPMDPQKQALHGLVERLKASMAQSAASLQQDPHFQQQYGWAQQRPELEQPMDGPDGPMVDLYQPGQRVLSRDGTEIEVIGPVSINMGKLRDAVPGIRYRYIDNLTGQPRETSLPVDRLAKKPFEEMVVQRAKPAEEMSGLQAGAERFMRAGAQTAAPGGQPMTMPETGNELADIITATAGSIAGLFAPGGMPQQAFSTAGMNVNAVAPHVAKALNLPVDLVMNVLGGSARLGALYGGQSMAAGEEAPEVAKAAGKGIVSGAVAGGAKHIAGPTVRALSAKFGHKFPGDVAMDPTSNAVKYLSHVHEQGSYVGAISFSNALMDKKSLKEAGISGLTGYAMGAGMGAASGAPILKRPVEIGKEGGHDTEFYVRYVKTPGWKEGKLHPKTGEPIPKMTPQFSSAPATPDNVKARLDWIDKYGETSDATKKIAQVMLSDMQHNKQIFMGEKLVTLVDKKVADATEPQAKPGPHKPVSLSAKDIKVLQGRGGTAEQIKAIRSAAKLGYFKTKEEAMDVKWQNLFGPQPTEMKGPLGGEATRTASQVKYHDAKPGNTAKDAAREKAAAKWGADTYEHYKGQGWDHKGARVKVFYDQQLADGKSPKEALRATMKQELVKDKSLWHKETAAAVGKQFTAPSKVERILKDDGALKEFANKYKLAGERPAIPLVSKAKSVPELTRDLKNKGHDDKIARDKALRIISGREKLQETAAQVRSIDEFREKLPTVMRRGSLERTHYEGYNVIDKGSWSTYADEEDKDVKEYVVTPGANIVDLSGESSADTKRFLEAVKKKMPEDFNWIKSVVDEGASYVDIEENEIDVIARELGFDGLRYESDDLPGAPSTQLIFDAENLTPIEDVRKLIQEVEYEGYGGEAKAPAASDGKIATREQLEEIAPSLAKNFDWYIEKGIDINDRVREFFTAQSKDFEKVIAGIRETGEKPKDSPILGGAEEALKYYENRLQENQEALRRLDEFEGQRRTDEASHPTGEAPDKKDSGLLERLKGVQGYDFLMDEDIPSLVPKHVGFIETQIKQALKALRGEPLPSDWQGDVRGEETQEAMRAAYARNREGSARAALKALKEFVRLGAPKGNADMQRMETLLRELQGLKGELNQTKTEPETKAPAEPKEDTDGRRRNLALRAEVDKLSSDEKDQVIKDLRKMHLTDEMTGLKNRAAYMTDEKKPFQAVMDLDNLKWVNDNISHWAGDQLIKAFARLLPKDAYHISGDEFILQSDNQTMLSQLLTKIQEQADEETVTLADKTKKGIGFSYGIGKTQDEAEKALQKHKAERLKEGKRSERGESPAGLTDTEPAAEEPAATPAPETPTDAPAPEAKKDIGYHAGDLGKAEYLHQQYGSARGTGHFGTGTYFVGDKKKLEMGDYKDRPMHEIDFSEYRLLRPATESGAFALHNFLKYMNDGRLLRAQKKIIHESDISDASYGEPDEAIPIFKKHEVWDEEEFKRLAGVSSDEYLENEAEVEGAGLAQNKALGRLREKARRIRDARISVADELPLAALTLGIESRRLKKLALEIAKSIENEYGYSEVPRDVDSASTQLLKKLGYEGVDVRHLSALDNTEFGSVIYDLKGAAKKTPADVVTAPGEGPEAETDTPAPKAPTEPTTELPQKDVHELAKWLRQQELDAAKEAESLTKKINELGGIAPPRGDLWAGEWRETVPLHLKNKNGMPMDEVADELGMTVAELLEAMMAPKAKPAGKVEDYYDQAREMLRAEKEGKPAKAVESEKVKEVSPSVKVAREVHTWLAEGRKFSSRDLYKLADEHFGGTQADNAYTPKDAYDAMELGINLYLKSKEGRLSVGPLVDKSSAKRSLKRIEDEILSKIPTQTRRTGESDDWQQFSTPPNLAYLAAWVANPTKKDLVLEPSAGIGGLAVFTYNTGAYVAVNELSERRAAILKEMGFDRVFTENAEQLHNILPGDITPSLVIMNPPFSAAATRAKGKRDTAFVKRHLDEALKRLELNGRLVAIVGRGMADTAPAFVDWWKKVKGLYNVRVNVGIDGRNYRKYGTEFDVQLLVIDNTGPTFGKPITGNYVNLEKLFDILEGIKSERIIPEEPIRPSAVSQPDAAGPESQEAARPGQGETGPRSPLRAPVSGVGTEGEHETGGGTLHSPGTDTKTDVSRPARPGDERPDAGRPDVRPQGEVVEADRPAAGEIPDRGEPAPTEHAEGHVKGGRAEPEVPGRLGVEAQEATKRKGKLTDSIYEEYVPQKLKIKGAQPHPGELAQSAAMDAVEPPAPSYKPTLAENIIKEGLLSLAQLEAVVYAGQAHSTELPNGQRKGFYIGDGTGVGKGREISGIIMDNMNQGRKKAVWLSLNKPLMKDAQRDFAGIGGDPSLVYDFGKKHKLGAEATEKEGIAFMTYFTLSKSLAGAEHGVSTPRLEQLVRWLGKDFDGVIAFDEAHAMKNAAARKGKRGTTQPSHAAQAGIELQRRFPKARIVYVSATAATEVDNLGYVERLGLWGEGTAFANRDTFTTKIEEGGLAAMELVARDMKALGLYISRSLSYNGVKYDRLVHNLTNEQREVYDAMAEGWQIVLQNIEKALDETESGRHARGRAITQFWSACQRFYNQVLTSMQMPKAIEAIHKDLEAGHSVVLQIVNTNEAAQNRKISSLEEDQTLEDLDMTPREVLMQYLEKAFPVQQWETVYQDGQKVKQPVLDSEGNPVLNREAIRMRDELLDKLGAMKVPDSPLDIILNTFGTDDVAEITGRSRRVVMKKDSSGRMKKHLEKRSEKSKDADAEAFMDGKKRVLVFSNAGGTGRSYHADNTVKNKSLRRHYLLQAGWQAERAVQGFGRTHRTNQAQPPEYILVTTDLKGQMRFISSIARRLDQLGALTRGQRQTGSQGIFSAADNLESAIARDALQRFYGDLVRGDIEGLDKEVIKQMGLDKSLLDEHGNLLEDADIRNTTQFLNRILALKSGVQNQVFQAYADRLEAMVRHAENTGTLDVGMETFRAHSVTVKDEKEVYRDEGSGAVTKFYQLEAKHRTEPVEFDEVKGRMSNVGFFRNKRSQRVYAVRSLGTATLPSGALVKEYGFQGQLRSQMQVQTENKLGDKESWEKIPASKAREIWEQELEKSPGFRTEKVYLVSGTILPIWNRLPEERVRVIRVMTEDGQLLLGRRLPEKTVDATLRRLGAERKSDKLSPQQVMDKVLNHNYTAHMANGWKLVRRRISGQRRIEITSALQDTVASHFHDNLVNHGVFAERIDYKTRFFIPIGTRGPAAIEAVLKVAPLVDMEAPDEASADVIGDEQALASGAATLPLKGASRKTDVPISPREIASKHKIIKLIEDYFRVPIRTKHIKSYDAAGVYKVKSGVIRTKIRHASSLRVVTHEAGHHLDRLLKLADKQFDAEFLQIPYVSSLLQEKPDTSMSTLRGEGVAEFVYMYLMKPNDAMRLCPKFHDYFEGRLLDYPDLQDKLLDVRKLIEVYGSASPRSRIAGFIVDEPKHNQFTLNKLYDYAIDENAPVTRAVNAITAGTTLDPEKDPQLRFAISKGFHGKADLFIRHGQYVWDKAGNAKKIGPSLREILAPIEDLGRSEYGSYLDDFVYYITAKRAVEVETWDMDQGGPKQSGLDLDDALDWVEEVEKGKHGTLFKQQFEDLVEFTRFNLGQLVKAGIMSRQNYEDITDKNQLYVPYRRVLPDKATAAAGRGQRFGNRGKAVHQFRGADLPITDPLQSIVRQTFAFTGLADKNIALNTLVGLADSFEETGLFFDKIPTPKFGVNVSIGQVLGQLDRMGIDIDVNDPDEALNRMVMTLFKPKGIGNEYDSLVTVWQNGAPVFYDFTDQDLLKAVMHMDSDQATMFGRLGRAAANVMRVGHTVNHRFPFYNMARDQLIAGTYSKHGYIPWVDCLSGIFEVLKQGDAFKEWLLAGGAMSTYDTFDKNYMEKSLKLVTRRHWTKEVKEAINPLTYLRALATASEYATNLGEFKRARKKGAHWAAASYAGRDVTVDHKRHGAKTQFLRDFIPFFNASLQGHDKFLREMKKNPGRTVLRFIAFITLPSIALYLLNRNNPHYQELPSYRKDLFWNIPIGDPNTTDLFLLYPKPFLPGLLFGSMPERFMEWLDHKDKRSFDNWAVNAAKTAQPNMTVWPIELPYEWKANFNFYTGAPIVPNREQYALTEQQYGPYTTETAKALGKLGISPRKADHAIRKTTGLLGKAGTTVLDQMLKAAGIADPTVKPKAGVADLPLIGDFFATTRAGGADTVSRFYDDLGKAESIKLRGARNEKEQELLNMLGSYHSISRSLSQMRSYGREIHASDIPADEKRALLDKIERDQINLVRSLYGKIPLPD